MKRDIEEIMDIYRIRPIKSKVILGQLDDGRLISLKPSVPSKLDDIIKTAVAMSNANGGIIMLGIQSKQMANWGLHEDIYSPIKALTTIEGIHGDIDGELKKIKLTFSLLTIGVSYKIQRL